MEEESIRAALKRACSSLTDEQCEQIEVGLSLELYGEMLADFKAVKAAHEIIPVPKAVLKKCAHCGDGFVPKRTEHVTCSHKCGKAFDYAKNRDAVKARRAKYNADNKEAIKAMRAKYWAENKAALNERRRLANKQKQMEMAA